MTDVPVGVVETPTEAIRPTLVHAGPGEPVTQTSRSGATTMPLGTPAPRESQAAYLAIFIHDNGIQIRLEREDAAGVGSDPALSDAAFQEALDRINASPDFTLQYAGKDFTTTIPITPTP